MRFGSCGGVGDVLAVEVGRDEGGAALDGAQEAAHGGFEAGTVGGPLRRGAQVAFEVLVEVLVGVELGAVGGQEDELEAFGAPVACQPG